MNNYEVWAPNAEAVRLCIDGATTPLTEGERGWWRSDRTPVAGERYQYQLLRDGEWSIPLPDPRSRRQPAGIHGPSAVVADDFCWTDGAYPGRELRGAVLYELHVGTFSPEGTFDGVIDRLDHLADLGVNAIELMPVQPFGGQRNWGYDGVDWFAVHEAYGGPEGLKRLVDAAHGRGIGVVLDVVYNHFGADGNYAGFFGPYTAGGATGWGEVVNVSGASSDEVRAYILDAVRQWLAEFHIDGLRLDAVHAIDDRLAVSLFEELADVAAEVSAATGVPRLLIAESDLNDPRLIAAREDGGYGLTGQWVDDVHHGIHTLVSGETDGYYSDYGTLDVLAYTLRHGWRFNNDYSEFRARHHGRPLDLERTPAWRLVTYTTTHDQTGNRAAGDRPSQHLSPTKLVLKAALVLTSPYTPMLFMGEEFAAQTPFPFFCSHTSDELNTATREGRIEEFQAMGWEPSSVPDPSDPATFASAKLDWEFSSEQRRVLDAYRRLISLRGELAIPETFLDWEVSHGEGWLVLSAPTYRVLANLSDSPCRLDVGGRLLYAFDAPEVTEHDALLGPWEFAIVAR
ncbi:malto-oligosyltrehalose trehalohydrolase [Corynebacterium uterequi]|uniref:Malto-oligosyltrehalose trehalohydrolase n=1 Tax=Corynebacterium uterequi TaxID=1072256 RepID=A0A0G3HHL7_9CORY|nr:malto-oligosyltrehalose trehalohydrolase [Corynebacterium uterequi]AKK11433.1 malto-oligosyltrehalose trehalohydrolase [Corynebacterium uterequi]